MQTSKRHHYQVEAWDCEGRITARDCFETSNGAVAYMADRSLGGTTFKVYCLTHADCSVCTPNVLAAGR